jgi:hypothetical protein
MSSLLLSAIGFRPWSKASQCFHQAAFTDFISSLDSAIILKKPQASD